MDEFRIAKPILIEDIVYQAIDEYNASNYYRALSAILPGIEATACKHYGEKAIGRSDFISFVNDHVWIVDLFAGYGDASSLSKKTFPDFVTEDKVPKPIKKPCFGKLCYYKMRCKLQHGKMIEDEIEFFESLLGPGGDLFMHKEKPGIAGFPASVIFGLIMMVVFARANIDIETQTDRSIFYSLINYGGSPESKTFSLDYCWGWEVWLADEIRVAREERGFYLRPPRLIIRYRI